VPAPRIRRHLLMPAPPSSEPYTPHQRKIEQPLYPGPQDRRRHARALERELTIAEREAHEARDATDISVHGAEPGIYIQFESPPNVELKLESLEERRKGIELVAVQNVPGVEGATIQLATVFVPDGSVKHFFNRFEQYERERTKKKNEPRHKDLVDRIAALRKATLRALWTDSSEAYPADDETIWWEIWLRRHDGGELARLLEFAAQSRLVVGERRLGFDDRIVVLVRGTATQLATSLDVLNDLAEVRKAKESSAYFVDSAPDEQANWVNELKRRMIVPGSGAPAVCILDTGVTRGHPLLEDLIAVDDAMAIDPIGAATTMEVAPAIWGMEPKWQALPPLAILCPFSLQHLRSKYRTVLNRLKSCRLLAETRLNFMARSRHKP
jgi:hypothetical protein